MKEEVRVKDYDLTFLYGLLGETAANILLYINKFGDSYATEIARHFSMHQQTVSYQMEKLEMAGILKSRYEGKTRLFRVNPRYVLRMELNSLLDKGLQYMPEELRTKFFQARTRPRTKGKALRSIHRDQE
jgi:DNA-binding transcriptional ArsR family regulator